MVRDLAGCAFAPLVREPLSVEAAAEMAVKLKALADPVRLRLFSPARGSLDAVDRADTRGECLNTRAGVE